MNKGLNENEWTAIKALVISLILEGGLAFIILAVIFKLIDAGSGRYLLSAIVQSLAALLAIIFAGVAILWNQEENSIRELGELRTRIISDLFKKGDFNQRRIVDWVKFCLEKYKSLDEKKREEIKPKMDSLLNIFYMGVNLGKTDLLKIAKRSYEYKEILEEIEKTFAGNDLQSFRINSFYLSSSLGLFDFFDTVVGAGMLFGYLFAKSDITEDKPETTVDRYMSLALNQSIILEASQAKVLMAKVKRAKRARGCLFKALISLYAITIAGAMVALAVMKGGDVISNSAATWIAAGPLALAIGAMAMTFTYLYNLVKGEKE